MIPKDISSSAGSSSPDPNLEDETDPRNHAGCIDIYIYRG